MADYLRTRTDKLLLCNDKLALSCCGNTVQDIYWAAIPCGVDLDYRTTCDEVDQCQYINRYFVSYTSLCQDDRLFVCECQRLYFKDYDTMEDSAKTNAFSISYTGPGVGIVEIDNSNITLKENSGAGSIYATGVNGTLQNLEYFIDSLSNWEASNQIGPGIPIYILSSGTKNINSFSFRNFGTDDSSFTLSYNGVSTSPILFDSDPNTLASNIQTSLENDLDLFGIEVNYNSNLTNGDVNKYFEIYFGGGLCGLNTSGIKLDKYKIVTNNTFDSIFHSISGQYGNYRLGDGIVPENWYNGAFAYFGDSYNLRGSGSSFSDPNNFCHYELNPDNDIDFYKSDIQCCPQKGAVLGKLQYLSNDYPTYLYDNNTKTFSNLEQTVVIGGQCYNLSPFFFLFDRTGRFNNDPVNSQQPYITPDCDINGGCDYDVPENCIVELFLAQFHKDIPWGPFGSYYPGIENRQHASFTLETGYIYDSFAGSPELFMGYQYAPNGSIITRGTWTNTETIDIIFNFKRAMSFYLGDDPFLDKNQLGVIDPTSVGSGLSIINNADCGGPVFLTFACSGKTVRDFVNAVNNVRTLAYDDYPSCNVFAFCLGSTEAGNISASKIINISNELFDQARSVKSYNSSLTYTSTFGGANPISDTIVSKADIFVGPHKYSDMWPSRTQRSLPDNSLYPQDDYDDPDKFVTHPLPEFNIEKTQLPPFGRHRMYGLPKSIDYITFRQNENGFGNPNVKRKITPWFTNIPGKLTNVNSITIGSGIPDYINKIEFNCQNLVVNITVTSGNTIIQSTGIDTNKFGMEYKVSDLVNDLNFISFQDNSGDSPYWPVFSETLLPYDIWLDDSTFWDATTYEPSVSGAINAVETPINWSYKEPLLNQSNHNLFSSSVGYLKNWSRQRTEYIDNPFSLRVLELPMSGCRPLNSRVVESNETVDCNGDEFTIGGVFVNYGCDSEICKTEWYLKTSRCNCANEAGCDNGPHLYNQPGNSQANKSTYNNYWITQPDLYICEYTFHPECDIPMLVKVPMQIVQNTDGNIYLAQYCGDSTFAVQYSDGLADLAFDPEGFITPSTAALKWSCIRRFFTDQKYYTSYYDPSAVPFSDFTTTAFCAECVGWCQYIDPASALRVKKEDIPREWPPVSYILERGNPAFCSVNLYDVPLDVAAGLDSPIYPQCSAWDTIYGVYPALPPEKARCNVLGPRLGQDMRVIFRPIVNPLTIGDLRGTAEVERIDINCASKCCGCFFKCAPNDLELRNGPYICPCQYSVSYNRTVDHTGQWAGICGVTDTNEFLDVYTGECESFILPVGRVFARPRVSNSVDYAYSSNYSASIDACCGCREGNANGTTTSSTTYNFSSCTGPTNPNWDGASYINPCPACGSSTFEVFGCTSGFSYPPPGSTSNTYFSCTYAPDPGPNSACYVSKFGKVTETSDATENNVPCGSISATWSVNITTSRNGSGCGGSLGIFGEDEFHTDEVYQEDGSFNQSAVSCGACPVGTQDSQSLSYILNWRANSSWICGYSNYSYAYSSLDYGSPVC